MRKKITYLTILLFFLSQPHVYAITIENKLGINPAVCKSSNISFEKYINCLSDIYLFKKLKKKERQDLHRFFSISQTYYDAVYDKNISEEKAYKIWNKLLSSNYGGKINKKKFKNMVNNSQCLKFGVYNDFIDCFFDEFRTFDIYQSSKLVVKDRLETIMFHALALKKKENQVLIPHKYAVGYAIDEMFLARFKGQLDGFDYLDFMIDGIASNFYKNKKVVKKIYSLNDKQIKNIITFLVAAIIISYLAKKVFAKGLSGSSSSASASTGSSSSVSSGVASSGAQTTIGSNPMSTYFMPKLFRYAPANSVLHKPWFKYGLF